MIHDQETQLLKLYGNRDEEEAALDLQTAIVQDLQGATPDPLDDAREADAQFQKAMHTLYSSDANNETVETHKNT